MPRVRFVLDEVTCKDPEDVLPDGDEFYIAGAIRYGNEVKAVLTKPIQIKKDQTKPFGAGGGVFDANVPDDATLRIALVAFDEDAGKDWSKHGQMITKIGTAVASALSTNPETASAGAILPSVIRGIGTIMKLDKDDELGKLARDVPIMALAAGEHRHQWNFKGKSGLLGALSKWNYSVRYRVIRN